jgi:hypothetical protein
MGGKRRVGNGKGGKGREEKRREGKGREGNVKEEKRREGKGRDGAGRAPDVCSTAVRPVWKP